MIGHGSKLDDEQEAALAALLVEPTRAAAALKAAIGPATLARWLRDPDSQLEDKAARRSLVDSAIASLRRVGGEAVEALQRGLECGNDAVEIRAAALISEYGFKGLEVLDLVDRVEEIEDRLMGVRDGKPLEARLAKLLAQTRAMTAPKSSLQRYQNAPIRYMREVLGVDPWAKQREIARLLLTPPYKVLGKACHSVGKTHVSACSTSWWFDTHPEDSTVITTAPTSRDVKDLLWTEVRGQRRRAIVPGLADHFIGEKAPEMETSESRYAKGFTASTGESFQGRHLRYLLLIFDEAIGVDPIFWETVKGMSQANG